MKWSFLFFNHYFRLSRSCHCHSFDLSGKLRSGNKGTETSEDEGSVETAFLGPSQSLEEVKRLMTRKKQHPGFCTINSVALTRIHFSRDQSVAASLKQSQHFFTSHPRFVCIYWLFPIKINSLL